MMKSLDELNSIVNLLGKAEQNQTVEDAIKNMKNMFAIILKPENSEAEEFEPLGDENYIIEYLKVWKQNLKQEIQDNKDFQQALNVLGITIRNNGRILRFVDSSRSEFNVGKYKLSFLAAFVGQMAPIGTTLEATYWLGRGNKPVYHITWPAGAYPKCVYLTINGCVACGFNDGNVMFWEKGKNSITSFGGFNSIDENIQKERKIELVWTMMFSGESWLENVRLFVV